MLTRVTTVAGDFYTDLQPFEVRQYLQGQSKGGAIVGYTDTTATKSGWLAVKNVLFVYDEQVDKV